MCIRRVHEGKTAVGIETSDPKLVNRLLSLQETTRSGGKSVLGKAVCKPFGKSYLGWNVDHECGQDFTYVNTLSMDIAFLHRSQSDYRLIISIFVPYIVRSLFPIVASEVKSFFSRFLVPIVAFAFLREEYETKPFRRMH